MNLSTSVPTASHRTHGALAGGVGVGGGIGGGGGGLSGEQKQQQHHHLTPQEAALRGASLAFQKQQQGSSNAGSVGGGRISRQTTGASVISRHPTGSSIRSQRDYADEAADRERDRERKALFLSPATPEQVGRIASHVLLRPGASPTGAEGKSASFIAATLAASRSASPGTAGADNGGGGGAVGAAGLALRRSPMLRDPLDPRRRGSVASSLGAEERMDTTSLAPATSLISLFEKRRDSDGEAGNSRGSPGRSVKRKLKSKSPSKTQPSNGAEDRELERESSASTSKPAPGPKPRIDMDDSRINRSPTGGSKSRSSRPQEYGRGGEETSSTNKELSKSRPKPITKAKPNVVTRAETPPPIVRRASTVIVSPKPRRPETKPRLEAPMPLTNDADEGENENYSLSVKKKAEAKSKVPQYNVVELSPKAILHPTDGGNHTGGQRRHNGPPKSPVVSGKGGPPTPRKSAALSERLSPGLKRRNTQRRSVVPMHDGQEESKLWTSTGQDAKEVRPTTSDSISSTDSFVSASSVLSRDETDSLLTVEAPSSRSITPKAPTSRPASTQPSMRPMRRSLTGSSQLPLDSLSDAIMAGSLASARHTPVSQADGRTPPPLPPSRKKGGGATLSKRKSLSRRASPHRLKHTLRQPKSHSDDEDARRPHHKKGLNHKKHAHHEGSRSRWREEITEREKKRYEAVWASNRGALLVASLQYQVIACSDPARHPESHQRPRRPLRDESYEELSEHVANVVVRDVWSRSRLPQPELAEVWDLVYGHGRAPEPGGLLHGALNKQEFVVGMWLIDQRLRGRKIPPRVGDSVWDSATGLRVLSPDHGHGHGLHKGRGKVR